MQIKMIYTSLMIMVLFIAGCSSISQQNPASSESTSSSTSVSTPEVVIDTCTTKECFIPSANDCNELSITLTQDAGVFKYSSSKDCIFTKTLISLNEIESQEMKTLLNGKSLTCKYEKGKFNDAWANSLISGIEYCEGELKDILVNLIMFAE